MDEIKERPGMLFLLSWVLGGWFCASLFMMFLAIANFKILRPENLRNADQVFSEIPEGQPRQLALKYVASEMNRYFFRHFNNAQLAIAVVAIVLFYFSRHKSRIVPGILFVTLGIAISMALYFTPTIEQLGRQIDFMPRNPRPPEVERFYALHTVDVVLELGKVVLIAAASGLLISSKKSQDARL